MGSPARGASRGCEFPYKKRLRSVRQSVRPEDHNHQEFQLCCLTTRLRNVIEIVADIAARKILAGECVEIIDVPVGDPECPAGGIRIESECALYVINWNIDEPTEIDIDQNYLATKVIVNNTLIVNGCLKSETCDPAGNCPPEECQ